MTGANASVAEWIWERFWSETRRVLDDLRAALTPHLGAMSIGAHPGRIAGEGEIRVGDARMWLRCPLTVSGPAEHEETLAAAFGRDAALVRILLGRNGSIPVPAVTIDARDHRWMSHAPDLGPFRLDDTRELEGFVLGLLVDR